MRRFGLLLLVLAAPGCSSADEPHPPTEGEAPVALEVRATPSLSVATDLGVRNARMPMEGILTAGQPSEEQLDALRAAGFQNFISLRPTAEDGAGWEEAHAAAGSYDFQRLPISGGEDLTRENVEAFAAALEESGDGPTVLYCASSNRVGAMFALKAFWLDGASAEEALELGSSAGLTRLEGRVVELMAGEG